MPFPHTIPHMEDIKKPLRLERLNMSTVHLDTLRTIHDFRCIADITTSEIEKAGPFLTLPSQSVLIKII
jgi:hypothetical protein